MVNFLAYRLGAPTAAVFARAPVGFVRFGSSGVPTDAAVRPGPRGVVVEKFGETSAPQGGEKGIAVVGPRPARRDRNRPAAARTGAFADHETFLAAARSAGAGLLVL